MKLRTALAWQSENGLIFLVGGGGYFFLEHFTYSSSVVTYSSSVGWAIVYSAWQTKRQHLPNLQVSRCCLLTFHSSIVPAYMTLILLRIVVVSVFTFRKPLFSNGRRYSLLMRQYSLSSPITDIMQHEANIRSHKFTHIMWHIALH